MLGPYFELNGVVLMKMKLDEIKVRSFVTANEITGGERHIHTAANCTEWDSACDSLDQLCNDTVFTPCVTFTCPTDNNDTFACCP